MKRLSLPRCLLYVFLLLVLRKIVIALIAMNTVKQYWEEVSVEKMLSSESFKRTVNSLPKDQKTFVLILNHHAVNMTLNWLCNTQQIDGVHGNSLIVTLDNEATRTIQNIWPRLRLFEFIVPGLKDAFNYGDGYYQLFYLFRSNLATALLRQNRTFWMIQQDTFWVENLSIIPLDEDSDIIFDRASEGGPLIAGGYYLARPTSRSIAFFSQLSHDISWWYAPDNAYMTSLCQLSNLARCGHLPFCLITNWQWLSGIQSGDSPPQWIQFDGETKLGGKLGQMKRLGFYFLKDDGKTCNSTAVELAKRSVSNDGSAWSMVASYSHQQFKLYQSIVDALFSTRPTTWFLNRWILPYAHFCMLSL